MKFKYDIGFLIPKYGEIIDREIVANREINYRVKMNYDNLESEDIQIFTEEVIGYYIEQYLSKDKNYTIMSFDEMQKFKENKLREYTENVKKNKTIK